MDEAIIAENFAAYLARHKDMRFPHRHSFYHLVYFTAGSGTHCIDFHTFPITPGQIYFMVPGQVHSWHFEAGVDGYIVNFSAELLHAFFSKNETLSRFPFLCGNATESVIQLHQSAATVTQLLQQIVNETAGMEPYRNDILCLNMLSVFMHTLRDSTATQNRTTTTPDVISAFRALVDKHYATMRLPKDYAALLHITPNHLNALCQETLGVSAGSYIRDRTLLEAKRILAGSAVSISEIAWQLSFKDNSYFTRFFKKHTSLTPEQFRTRAAAHN